MAGWPYILLYAALGAFYVWGAFSILREVRRVDFNDPTFGVMAGTILAIFWPAFLIPAIVVEIMEKKRNNITPTKN